MCNANNVNNKIKTLTIIDANQDQDMLPGSYQNRIYIVPEDPLVPIVLNI